ncbi:uncharacterized protein TNCV_822801 [Trichonephila clavipes]|nr:uncharacterized protein TNCV_822801 [Trichonephila clavipes]
MDLVREWRVKEHCGFSVAPLPNYNVRYVQYLGDGDSKGFLRVQESNIYGDEFPVEKLECIGHVQKRMGARLRAPKNNLKSTKLSDNKPISDEEG